MVAGMPYSDSQEGIARYGGRYMAIAKEPEEQRLPLLDLGCDAAECTSNFD
jgi:hypothetical protein